MKIYSAERRRRIEQFAEYFRLMGMRRREIVKNDDCFLIFDEAVPEGVDATKVEESATAKAECLANGGPASDDDDAVDMPPSNWSQEKPRYAQTLFRRECFVADLSNGTLFLNEAELILQQRSGFYWAKDRKDLVWIRKNWDAYVRWNPLQKIYLYSDEESAAEDLAFIIFDVWKFPLDWPWTVTASSFHTGHRFENRKRIE